MHNVKDGSDIVQGLAKMLTKLLEQQFVFHFGEFNGDLFKSRLGLRDGDVGLALDLLQLGGSCGQITRSKSELEAGCERDVVGVALHLLLYLFLEVHLV